MSKRHPNAEPKSRGTGHSSGNDRSHHQSARGSKLLPLSSLSRQLPSGDELWQTFDALKTETDRGCALIAASLLENTLALTINCHFPNYGLEFKNQLFEGSGPLATFSAKIKVGCALAIYDQKVQKAFETVKDIRNAFAHSLKAIDFSHPTIANSCKSLDPRPFIDSESDQHPARRRYVHFCYTKGKQLFDIANQKGGGTIHVELTM